MRRDLAHVSWNVPTLQGLKQSVLSRSDENYPMASSANCVSFVLSDRAMDAARRYHFSKAVTQTLAEAPHYAEGTGVRFTVSQPRDLAPHPQAGADQIGHLAPENLPTVHTRFSRA